AEPPWRSEDDVASVWADDGGVPAASAQDRERVGIVPGRSPGTQKLGCVVLECGWRQMTRVACDVGQPRHMETCGAEEPYEGNLHVRFCGGIGRVIADPTRTGDCLQPPLVPRCGFRQRLTPSVRRQRRGGKRPHHLSSYPPNGLNESNPLDYLLVHT